MNLPSGAPRPLAKHPAPCRSPPRRPALHWKPFSASAVAVRACVARRAKTWSNESGEVLRALPGLWVAERPFVWNGIDVGGKMAVVRLSDGSLWLHSPVELDEKLRRALEELGPVRHAPRPS